MVRVLLFIAVSIGFAEAAEQTEVAKFGEPLKEEYWSGDARILDTGDFASGVSVMCDVGQALPSTERENWYINRPIDGLSLELQALAVNESELDSWPDVTYGFAVFIKNGDSLRVLPPMEGDIFLAWDNEGTEYKLRSEESRETHLIEFDLLSGNGFYYERIYADPNFFLSNCSRSTVENLPVYDWEFEWQRQENVE